MTSPHSSELNPKQQKAVEAADGPLLIVAGAGTGKTKTLTHRIARLIENGVKPEKICALTFTNKAAREMGERVHSIVPMPPHRPRDIFGAPDPFLGTFHSFGARLLRREARHLGRTPQFVIFDDTDSFTLIKRILKERGISREDIGPGELLGAISAIKSRMKVKENIRAERSPATRYAKDLFPIYEDALRAHNAFDFDDLIDKVVVVFEEHADVLAAYRERFTHILVDEYQDVNNRQYDLVRLLVGGGKHISVVGDDQQTIYSWRGSNFEIFMNFEHDWPGAEVVILGQNYRSTSTIISAASAVIAQNLHQKPKKLWTKNEDGEPIMLAEAGDEEEEAFWIAEQVAGCRLRVAGGDKIGTTAVLYRTNAQSRPIEQALIARRIPYHIYGGLRFYERREVKDIIAGVRFAVNPNDSVSRERLEKAFTKRIFRALAERVGGMSSASPVELINAFLEASDYFTYAKKNLTNIADRSDNIAELIRFAGEFTETTPFLEQITLVQATDEQANSKERMANGPEKNGRFASGDLPQAIILSTMHLAKGLEFDRVFIAGCSEGLLPHGRSLGSDAELEEERRLMYVAMTRAKKHLAVSFYDIPSRFISEMPQKLVNFVSLVSDEQTFSDGEERYISLD